MNVIKRTFLTAAAALLAAAWAPAALAQQDNLVETIKQRGKLMVGFSSFSVGRCARRNPSLSGS